MTIHLSDQARATADALLSIRAVACSLERPFTLVTGRTSPLRLDAPRLAAFPGERREIVRRMAEAVRQEPFDLIVESGSAAVPCGSWIADLVGLPLAVVRPDGRLEGEWRPGQQALLVDDAASDGTSQLDRVRALRAAGVRCAHAVVVVAEDRAAPALAAEGLTLHAATTWGVVVDAGFRGLDGLRAFLADPASWRPVQ